MTVLAALCAASCSTPGMQFMGTEPAYFSVGQREFKVFVTGDRAQAIRVSREWLPDQASVFRDAEAAITAVSGCRVRRAGTMKSDVSVVNAILDCGP